MRRRVLAMMVAAVFAMTTTAYAQTSFGSSYTLYSTGEDTDYSGTIALDTTLPAGIEASGFFDHFRGDKTYVEATVGAEVGSGLMGIYEVQDQASVDLDHLVGIAYRRAVGPVAMGGKFFPYSTNGATDFAAEINASTMLGRWMVSGFVDLTRDAMLDEMRWFSKSQATRTIMPAVAFVGEYRWRREMGVVDRAVWIGLSLGT